MRILAPRNRVLPSSVLLPNLQKNKESLSRRIMYQGLPDQCFICRHFGHLGRDCPRKRYRSEEACKLTSKVGRSDWTLAVAKHTFKHSNSPVNSIFWSDAPKSTFMEKEIPSKVSPASHHKLEVSFCMPHKGNQLRDKGNQVPHPVPQV